MARMPKEPEAFAEQVAEMLLRMCPDRSVELSDVLVLRINGRSLALENLYRMVRADPERGVELVEEYLDHLMEGESASNAPMPYEIARPRIMLRIQPETIFGHLDREMVAHAPFVNDTVLLYVIDMPHLTVSITVEQMMRWGVDVEEIDRAARENLREYSPDLKVRFIESEAGARAAVFTQQDGYDASRLLLRDLYDRLVPELGQNFFVATPSRDTFLAVSAKPEDFREKLHSRVEQDYRRLPYPITDRYFIVTRDGIAGTAAA